MQMMKLHRNRQADVISACMIVGLPVAIAFIGVPLAGIPLTAGGFGIALGLLAMWLPFAAIFLLAVAYQRHALRWKKRLIMTFPIGFGAAFVHYTF
jgi:hypothetical protein